MSLNNVEWDVEGKDLELSAAGIIVAENLMSSISESSNFAENINLSNIIITMDRRGVMGSMAARGFMAKINFALKEHAQYRLSKAQ